MKHIVFAIILSISAFASGCAEVIDTGHQGVEKRFGKIVGEGSLGEGLYFYNPLTTSIIEIDTRTQTLSNTSTAYTQDVQQATIVYTLNYNLNPASVVKIYRTVGNNWIDQLIPQRVEGKLKETIGLFTAEVLVSKRQDAQEAAKLAITEALKEVDIVVTGFELNNVDYSDVFEKSIEDKVVAEQKAKEEKNRTVQIEEKAKQTITAAEAEAESIRIRASALAKNPSLVELEAVNKWNGVLPTYMMGNTVPFLNLSK